MKEIRIGGTSLEFFLSRDYLGNQKYCFDRQDLPDPLIINQIPKQEDKQEKRPDDSKRVKLLGMSCEVDVDRIRKTFVKSRLGEIMVSYGYRTEQELRALWSMPVGYELDNGVIIGQSDRAFEPQKKRPRVRGTVGEQVARAHGGIFSNAIVKVNKGK